MSKFGRPCADFHEGSACWAALLNIAYTAVRDKAVSGLVADTKLQTDGRREGSCLHTRRYLFFLLRKELSNAKLYRLNILTDLSH